MDMQSAYRDLYRDIVRDHGKAPCGAGDLDDATTRAESYNPLCGDRVAVSLRLDRDRCIRAIRHVTDGCLLCNASVSLMTKHAVGLGVGDFDALKRHLGSLVTGAPSGRVPAELNALAGVAAFPSRRRCVMLPWETLSRALYEVGVQPVRCT